MTLAQNLTDLVNEAAEGLELGSAPLLDMVTATTAELLKYWFQQDFADLRPFNFHIGQRQAILNAIYAHEVLGTESLSHLYGQVAPDVLLNSVRDAQQIQAEKNRHPKYCLKMATGTGKTWVLQALLVWQVLNANRSPENPRYTKNFLVIAPGLIVYERLLDAFQGKERKGRRDFEQSDLFSFRELFLPDSYRDEVFGFVQSTFCAKEEIGRKVTSGGLIAVTNWQAIKEEGGLEEEEFEDVVAPGVAADPKDVVKDLLPLTPGKGQGNDLNALNRQYERGNLLEHLRNLPNLMVFNDEAHRIHEFKKEGEVNEVEWQKSLNYIAAVKKDRFFQVDFTATPYNQVGTGNRARLAYFPHIIVDFDLRTALRMGLVKSLVLDKRSEIGALSHHDLEFKANRDTDGNATLSEGQRIMLRAGLTKLNRLAVDFAKLDPDRHPKMLVMCEDTTVTPLVENFLKQEGLADDDILRVDSNRKGDLSKEDWSDLRERLFDLDRRSQPRVVVSVLMLREGFDVNNICVIVPLRASKAQILLEQTIGRGLRLMWREQEFEDEKRENRQLIRDRKAPNSLIDVLSIVEHPAFQSFYDDLIQDGLLVETDDDDDDVSTTGDLISVPLRDGYQEFDFAIPFLMKEREEELADREFDPESLTPFTNFTYEHLKGLIGVGDQFHSEDVESKTRFGDYRVNGGVMTATGYNDYLSRIVKRVSELLTQPLTDSSRVYANRSSFPYLQVNQPQLAAWIDGYIRRRLFGRSFNPMVDENWRLLLIDAVTEHTIGVIARELLRTEESQTVGEAEVMYRRLSEVPRLAMRASYSEQVRRCIYERLPYPSRSGLLERNFILWADTCSTVEAFCKVHEQKHDFVKLRYIKEDGLPGSYSPDFLVRTASHIYLAETKAQNQLRNPDVMRKRTAALAWCSRINGLLPEERQDRQWKYVLVGEDVFYDWREKNATLAALLEFAALRHAEELGQQSLDF